MTELRRLLGYTRPYIPSLSVSVLLMAIAGAAHAFIALLIRPVFDRVLDPATADQPVLLLTVLKHEIYLHHLVPNAIHNVWTMVAFGIVSVFLIKGVAEYAGNYLVNRVGYRAVTDLRQATFQRVLHMDTEFYEMHSTGRLMSSIMSDIEKIQVAVSHILADWLRQSFAALGLLYVILQTDWKLALVSLASLPLVLIPTVRIGKKIRRATRSAQNDAAELSQILQEALSGHMVVKAFHAERHESLRFHNASLRLMRSSLRYVAQQSLASPLIEFFAALTIVALLTYARNQIKAGAMTTGEFSSFIVALLMLYEPVKRLTGIHNIFQQALGASQKVFEYLDREERIKDHRDAVELSAFQDSIVLDRVGFHYPQSPDGFQLADISLQIPAGAVAALVGPSGGGKSTLAALLLRLYDVNSGQIRIDNHDIRHIKMASLRGLVSVVAQDTFLFNETVASNIRYGRREATDADVRQAARNAMAEEFISSLPQGFNTMIGERGAKLSGGQRQRIAIARALLRNSPILILDEATSHLDTESERLVQDALGNLMQGRTVFVIAHRLSTIRRADQIIVVEAGRIRETGTHDQLLQQGGLYHYLHQLQFLEPDPLTNP
ncbi:MAG: ABC transporter ATP-binding protein [Acidobacteriia bacterium]|nr:ABC transporter ATP-binding protein [Terriglobia bacterium]